MARKTYDRRPNPAASDAGERLHKVMARAGVASKRKCEELIRQGRVTIDGAVVEEMGVKVDLERQDVRFDGERLKPESYVYYLGYKPRGMLSTTEDRFGRKTVASLVADAKGRRLFLVGRLDLNAEGLVLLTNDGGFAQDVSHPRRRLDRTYFLKVLGSVTRDVVDEARAGVWLSDGRTDPMEVQVVRVGKDISTLKCRVVESQHRSLSRVWAKLGHPVRRMVLVRLGPIGTQGLSKNSARKLTPEEVELLRSGPPAEIRLSGKRFGRAPEAAEPSSDWGRPAAATEDDVDDDLLLGDDAAFDAAPPRSGGPARSGPDRKSGRPQRALKGGGRKPLKGGLPPRGGPGRAGGGGPGANRPKRRPKRGAGRSR
jgi:23S rRNA pseudouridine2605 synthase